MHNLRDRADEATYEEVGGITMLVNPTSRELRGFASKHEMEYAYATLRGLVIGDDLYFWPAHEADHAEVARKMRVQPREKILVGTAETGYEITASRVASPKALQRLKSLGADMGDEAVDEHDQFAFAAFAAINNVEDLSPGTLDEATPQEASRLIESWRGLTSDEKLEWHRLAAMIDGVEEGEDDQKAQTPPDEPPAGDDDEEPPKGAAATRKPQKPTQADQRDSELELGYNEMDVQSFLDARILMGDTPEEALTAAKAKFNRRGLKLSPQNRVLDPKLPKGPSAAPPPTGDEGDPDALADPLIGEAITLEPDFEVDTDIGTEVPIYQNPSSRDIRRMVHESTYTKIRIVVGNDGSGDVYAYDAALANHDDVHRRVASLVDDDAAYVEVGPDGGELVWDFSDTFWLHTPDQKQQRQYRRLKKNPRFKRLRLPESGIVQVWRDDQVAESGDLTWSMLDEPATEPEDLAWSMLNERYIDDFDPDESYDGLAENLEQIYELEYKLHRMRTSVYDGKERGRKIMIDQAEGVMVDLIQIAAEQIGEVFDAWLEAHEVDQPRKWAEKRWADISDLSVDDLFYRIAGQMGRDIRDWEDVFRRVYLDELPELKKLIELAYQEEKDGWDNGAAYPEQLRDPADVEIQWKEVNHDPLKIFAKVEGIIWEIIEAEDGFELDSPNYYDDHRGSETSELPTLPQYRSQPDVAKMTARIYMSYGVPEFPYDFDEFFDYLLEDRAATEAVLEHASDDVWVEILEKVAFPAWYDRWRDQGIDSTIDRIKDGRKTLDRLERVNRRDIKRATADFNAVLNLSHQTGPMLDYIEDRYNDVDSRFLDRLSDPPSSTTRKWDREIEREGFLVKLGPVRESSRRRYAKLSTLLDEWANDPSDFDEVVGLLMEDRVR